MQFLDQLCLKFKAEHSVAKAHNYIWGGGTPHKKRKLGRGGTAHIFLMGNNWNGKKTYTGRGGDTAHTLLMGGTTGWGHRTTLRESK